MVIDVLHPEKTAVPKTEYVGNWPKCTRPHQMSSLCLNSEPILVVARPQCWRRLLRVSFGFGMIYDSLDYVKKKESQTNTCKTWPVREEKDLKKTAKGTQEQNEESQFSSVQSLSRI